MKALFEFAASLLVGIVIGCFVGYRYYETRVTNEAVQQMVEGAESFEAAQAARNVRAMEAISTGDTQRALELLSRPVADYYLLYAEDGAREQRSQVRMLIEQVAATNSVLAARIAEASTNRLR